MYIHSTLGHHRHSSIREATLLISVYSAKSQKVYSHFGTQKQNNCSKGRNCGSMIHRSSTKVSASLQSLCVIRRGEREKKRPVPSPTMEWEISFSLIVDREENNIPPPTSPIPLRSQNNNCLLSDLWLMLGQPDQIAFDGTHTWPCALWPQWNHISIMIATRLVP